MFGIIGIILIGIVFFGQFAPQLDGYLPAILLVAGVILFLVDIRHAGHIPLWRRRHRLHDHCAHHEL